MSEPMPKSVLHSLIMASFSASRLISLLLILGQLIQLISSTTLTLKSSHSHLNLNRILNSNFDRSEVCLSFKYKPLNQRFTLISGILDRQSNGSEISEPLKFVLIVNPDDRLELIVNKLIVNKLSVNKANKAARENWLSSYFLEVNQTKVIPRQQVDSLRYGEGAGSCHSEKNKILEDLADDRTRIEDKEQRPNKNVVDLEKKNNWRLLGVQISRERLQIAHTSYASCLLNGRNQSNCRQRILVYQVQQRTENEQPDDRITKDTQTNADIQTNRDIRINRDEANKEQRSSGQFIELNQLLIGKEWSESDSYLINPGNRSVDAVGPSDLKQLNETEDQHSTSQIHNNFLQSSVPNFQTSNQEQFSGLIGCLNAIELNGHYLEFSLVDEQSSVSERFEANEPRRIDSVETSDQVVKADKKIKNHRPTETAFRVRLGAHHRTSDGAVKAKDRSIVEDPNTIAADRRSIEVSNAANDVRRTTEVARNAKDFRVLVNTSQAADREQIEFEEEPDGLTDWWKVHRWDSVLVGKIELNVCNQSDPCANYCLHNATCMLNEDDGQPICHCDLVGYTGERCFFRKFSFRFKLRCSSSLELRICFYFIVQSGLELQRNFQSNLANL